MVKEEVKHGNVLQACRALGKKLQREGIHRILKICYYEKPSVKRLRKDAEAARRRCKMKKRSHCCKSI